MTSIFILYFLSFCYSFYFIMLVMIHLAGWKGLRLWPVGVQAINTCGYKESVGAPFQWVDCWVNDPVYWPNKRLGPVHRTVRWRRVDRLRGAKTSISLQRVVKHVYQSYFLSGGINLLFKHSALLYVKVATVTIRPIRGDVCFC